MSSASVAAGAAVSGFAGASSALGLGASVLGLGGALDRIGWTVYVTSSWRLDRDQREREGQQQRT